MDEKGFITEDDLNKAMDDIAKLTDKPGTGVYSSFEKLVADKPSIDPLGELIISMLGSNNKEVV